MSRTPHSFELTRRAAMGVLAVGAASAALWPRRPRSQLRVPAGRVTLQYWEKWTGPEGEAVQSIVDEFNASQDRIWVVRTPVSDIAAKAMVAIGGGDPPDIVGLYSYNVPLFAEAKAAMSTDEFDGTRVDGNSALIDPDEYAPAVRNLLSFEGRQWAGVNTCYTLALYYNRAVFRDAGIDPDRPPRTTAELDALAARLDVFNGSSSDGDLLRAGFLPNLPAWWPYFCPIMFGGKLYDPIGKRALLDEPASVKAYTWVQGYPTRLGPARSAKFANSHGRSFHSPQDPFISGKVAMIVQGPWIANFINLYGPRDAAGKQLLDFAAAPVPVDEDVYDPSAPLGMLEADVLMIPRGCPHPEEAYAFLAFTQRRGVQEKLAYLHCKSSPMRRLSPGFMENHPSPRCVGVHDAVVRSPRATILPQTRAWQQMADLTNGAFDAIWNGAEPASVLARIQSRAQENVDKAEAMKRRRSEAEAGSEQRP
ncbi:MAG: extracellular solute-binding protein [Pyrinomonadaceae bacterium]|nr:extracellular solute-binding protein [Phycisphaerales bacterium]